MRAVALFVIVAVGTSAAELVTTMVSTVKDDRDIALGNILGSSVYNILLILGGWPRWWHLWVPSSSRTSPGSIFR